MHRGTRHRRQYAALLLRPDLQGPALIEKVREDERERHANELDVAVAMAEHLPYYGHEQGCYNSKIPWGPEPCSGCVSLRRAFSQGQRDEREACIAAVSAPTLHDDSCCSNGCTLMHSSEWEATRRIQIALGFPLSEEPPPPYRCDGSCNCTAAAFIAAIRAREERS